MKWLTVKFSYNFAVLILSTVAFIYTNSFVKQCNKTVLPLAPKATDALHKVLIPPMESMQAFVLIFDGLIALYYIY